MHKLNFKHVITVKKIPQYEAEEINKSNFADYLKVMIAAGHKRFTGMTYGDVRRDTIKNSLFGAVVDGKVVGVVGGYTPPKYVTEEHAAGIYGLSVLPEYRRRGVGAFLACKIVERLKWLGFVNVYVAVHESRQDAIRLYERMGFMELPEGIKRYDVINWLIKKYGYKRYLEIGVRKPEKCFDKIVCRTKAAVDPAPRGKCKYVMTSDEFFKVNEDMYDIIFIDGLHLEAQVLKDIENSLAILKPNGTIVLHDCNPPTEQNQTEIENDGKWNGTVWKAYMYYRRKDYLKMAVINEDWGLGVIRRGKQEPLTIEAPSYQDLEANRDEWLNLMSYSQFKLWVEDEPIAA